MTVQSPPPPMAPPPPPPVAPPPPPGGPQAQRKGMGPLGWVLIGCGVIIVIAIVVMGAGAYLFKTKVVDPMQKNPGLATAKLIVQANPDLELVSEDDNAGTLTVHNKQTNETVTVNMDEIKNGKFKFSSDKGSASFDMANKDGATIKVQDDKGQVSTITTGAAGAQQNLPSWLQVYPGGTVVGGVSATNTGSSVHSFAVTTTDSADKVLAFYHDQLTANGLTVQPTTTLATGGQTGGGFISASSADKQRTAQVIVGVTDGKTTANISYEENKK